MNTPKLIIVTGHPGSGKTTLAKRINAELHLPIIEKDTIKEILFERLGWSDRVWSQKLGMATYELMDYFIEQSLKSGQSFIVESNFNPTYDNEKFNAWHSTHDYEIIQLICHAKPAILLERFTQRAASGARHPGHGDSENLDEWREHFASIPEKAEELDVPSRTLYIDTTNPTSVDTQAIIGFIHAK